MSWGGGARLIRGVLDAYMLCVGNEPTREFCRELIEVFEEHDYCFGDGEAFDDDWPELEAAYLVKYPDLE